MERKTEQLLTSYHLCSAELFFPASENIVTCRYCGHLNQRPISTGETLVRMERADELRRQCAFEEAARSYEHVLREHPDEHAALWGRLMCKYGVEVVEEKRDGRLISRHLLCHRARNSSIRNEGDYRHACALAAPEIREQYERDAEYIDKVQAGIRARAQEMESYDVFICYKETDLRDPLKQTPDSGLARNLCNRFQRDGYRVFFAPFTLQDKYGADYEAEIYHAIDTAKVMLVVGLQPEHFEATWPRSEWVRFMELMEERHSMLIPVFGGGMRAESLPVEFRNQFLQGCSIDTNPNYVEDLSNLLYRRIPRIAQTKSNTPAPQPGRAPAEAQEETAEDLLEQGKLYYQDGVNQNLQKAFNCFERAASTLPEAQRMLGECYLYGKGVEKDLVQAFRMYRSAALRGIIPAQNALGSCYYFGNGTEKDYVQAAVWYRKAAEKGFAKAQYNLGTCYCHGHGVAQDDSMAVQLYQKAAGQGYAKAQNTLGNCYYYGRGVAQDFSMAVHWYQKAAEQGYANAQYNLGNCYYHGQGVAQDFSMAVHWYQKAAELGDAYAQDNLGTCYYNGQGVAQDYSKAVHWYKKAAEQGDAGAQNILAFCYENGQGVAQDYSMAVHWYQKAAELGDAYAQDNLGTCYYNGQGVAQDYSKAVHWYKKAAEQGHADAQYNLAFCYRWGYGVDEDLSQAAYWYQKAAELSHADAQYNLAFCHKYGNGIAKDLSQAEYWYQKAAEQGNASALEALTSLRKNSGGLFKRLFNR